MISLIQEITQTASSPSGHSTGITLSGWIYLGVFAAWTVSIYIFALRSYKIPQNSEEKRHRVLHISPPRSADKT